MSCARACWLSLALASCTTASSSSTPANADPTHAGCPELETDVEHVWGADAKAKLRASVAEVGAEVGAHTVERVSYELDQISSDWLRLRDQLCRDHARRRVSTEQYAERSRCLDDALIRMRTFVTMLQSGGLRDTPAMLQASARIDERLHACGEAPRAAGGELAARAPAASTGSAADRATEVDPEARGVQFAPADPAATAQPAGPGRAAAGSSKAGPRAKTIYARSIAVVIGIDDYQQLPDLRAAEADAQAVAESLRARGFEVELVLGAEATRDRIMSLLGDQLKAKLARDDRVLVFFAGHGVSVDEGDHAMGYLMPVAARRELPVATGIAMTELQGWLGGYAAKHVMFVADACYSGLALPHRGVAGGHSGEQLLRMATREPVRFTLVAGQDNQEAWEMRNLRRGAFTHFFLQALEGDADDDQDRLITGSEIAHYVGSRVFGYVWQHYRSEQRPTSASSGRGEFIFFLPPDALAGTHP